MKEKSWDLAKGKTTKETNLWKKIEIPFFIFSSFLSLHPV
jgi:hypothetical protein